MGEIAASAVMVAVVLGGSIVGFVWLRKLRAPGQSVPELMTAPTVQPLPATFAFGMAVGLPVAAALTLVVSANRDLAVPIVAACLVLFGAGVVLLMRSARRGRNRS